MSYLSHLEKKNRFITTFIWLTALAYSIIILNRFAFSSIGVHSFGRIWQYFVSYQEFGFIPRSGLGTLVNLLALNSILKNQYHNSYLLQNFFFLALALILLIVSYRLKLSIWQSLMLFLSPATLAHAAYCTGSTHIHQLIILTLIIFYARRPLSISILTLIGVLIHEGFIVIATSGAVLHFLKKEIKPGDIVTIAASLFPAALMAGYFVLHRTQMPRAIFEQAMANKIPDAVGQNYLWSGYFEIFSGIGPNFAMGMQHMASSEGLIYLTPAIAYIFLLTIKITLLSGGRSRALAVMASLLPLIFIPLGTDIYRWLGFSAFSAISAIIILEKTKPAFSKPHFILNRTIAFCFLLTPFGIGIIEDPLPIHRFAYEIITARL